MKLVKRYFYVLLPSLLVASLPVIFFYNHNATKLNLQSIALPLLIMVVLAMIASGISLLVYRSSQQEAVVASVVFLVFFYAYGTLYNRLLVLDIFQIEHVTIIPIFLFIAYLVIKLGQKVGRLVRVNYVLGIEVVVGVLLLYNLIGIVPVELRKQQTNNVNPINNLPASSETANVVHPDIYYIVVDESVAFDAIRTYWKYPKVDDFENFLKSKGFFVAENSHSQTFETMVEIASRLNLEDMSTIQGYSAQDWYEAISNNKVMQVLKGYGYTTIVLDQVHAANGYVNKTPITADYDFTATKIYSRLWAFDDFFSLVFTRTLLRPITDKISQSDPFIAQHRTDVLYFFDKIAHLQDIPSPKFVYGQVLLTHVPLIFDENGGLLDQKNYYNWDYYIESYKFEITKVTDLINTLLAQSNPTNPPIIILQSDHGFRNIDSGHAGSKILANYPEAYKYDIINALLLPGYDTSQLPDDINPIDTFIIILDHYFGQSLPLK
jgi:hypothetical protein